MRKPLQPLLWSPRWPQVIYGVIAPPSFKPS
jgi:hypothetical protein